MLKQYLVQTILVKISVQSLVMSILNPAQCWGHGITPGLG